MPKTPKDYANNVFINCPFDDEYNSLFHALIFVIHDCGFIARCALEISNSAQVRIDKIYKIIDECKFGIHDISRATIDPNTGFSRFNMPFELGIFLGCQHYSKNYNREKVSLIVDEDQFRYKNFISDIAGQDIKSHAKSEEKLIKCIRDFLVTHTGRKSIAGGSYIHGRYVQFLKDLPVILNGEKLKQDELTFIDYSGIVSSWINQNRV